MKKPDNKIKKGTPIRAEALKTFPIQNSTFDESKEWVYADDRCIIQTAHTAMIRIISNSISLFDERGTCDI